MADCLGANVVDVEDADDLKYRRAMVSGEVMRTRDLWDVAKLECVQV